MQCNAIFLHKYRSPTEGNIVFDCQLKGEELHPLFRAAKQPKVIEIKMIKIQFQLVVFTKSESTFMNVV